MNPIQFKRSHVTGKVPQSADLLVGELAVNLIDRKIYSKNSSGTVVELAAFNLDTSGAVNKSGDTITGMLHLQGGLSVQNNVTFTDHVGAGSLTVNGWTTLGNVNLTGSNEVTGALNVSSVATFTGSAIVPTPVDDNHAATKKYVDDMTGSLLPRTGGTLSGHLQLTSTHGIQWGSVIGNDTTYGDSCSIEQVNSYTALNQDYMVFTKSDGNGTYPDGGFAFTWKARSSSSAHKTGEILRMTHQTFAVTPKATFRAGLKSNTVVSATAYSSSSSASTVHDTVVPVLSHASVLRYTITGDIEFDDPDKTSVDAGSWVFYIIQDSVGGHAVTWGSNYHVLSGEISTEANAVNVCQVICDGTDQFDVIVMSR